MNISQAYSPSAMTVLIVGGGIGGLTTALALQQQGIKALVFERARQFREVGSGLILAGNAVKALDRLGLSSERVCGTLTLQLKYLSVLLPDKEGVFDDARSIWLVAALSPACRDEQGCLYAGRSKGL